MILTRMQRDIAQKIGSGVLKNTDDFLKNHVKLNQSTNQTSTFEYGKFAYVHGCKTLVPANETEFHRQLLEFVGLIDFLHNRSLIILTQRERRDIIPIFTEDGHPDKKFQSLINKFYFYEFNPSSEYEFYLARDFMTQQEWDAELEKKDRRQAQSLTKTLAIVSIVASVLTAVGTSIFNYMTYTNERKVIITNLRDSRDTIFVKVVPDTTKDSKIDTLRTNGLRKQ